MNEKIKNLYSKLFRKQSDSPNTEITIGMDENGEVFVSYNCPNEAWEDLSAILFFIYSGQVGELIADTLPSYIDDDNITSAMIQDITIAIRETQKLKNSPSDAGKQPVVDPLMVFNTPGGSNESS